jgi:hypothetical protein
VGVLLGLYEAAERVVQDAQAITQPVQLLISGADWVVHSGRSTTSSTAWAVRSRPSTVLPGFFHDTLGERDRGAAVKAVRQFVLDRFDARRRRSTCAGHRSGHTADEARELAQPLSPLLAARPVLGASRAPA